jgi:hypothetical protein
MTRSIWKIIALAISIIVFSFSVQNISFSRQSPVISTNLADISGVAWVSGRHFLAVHDAKDPVSPRLSLLTIPGPKKAFAWQTLEVDWPDRENIPRDLEGITAIEGTDLFLLNESGDRNPQPRLFLISYKDKKVKIIAQKPWPVPVKNVEAIAVTRSSDRYLFLYAERGENQGSTEIRWTELSFDPWQFGEFRGVSFTSPLRSGTNIRAISDITLDRQGNLYISSASDPGNRGGFRSEIYRIGRMDHKNGILLDRPPQKLGQLDGLKVEGLTIQPEETSDRLFFGTDDESYGGVFRPLPAIRGFLAQNRGNAP